MLVHSPSFGAPTWDEDQFTHAIQTDGLAFVDSAPPCYSRADLALSHPLDPKRLKGWARSVSSNGMQIPGAPPLREIQTTDGAKVVFKDRSWLLLRPSGTEPLLRIYAEARNSAAIRKLIKVGRSIGKRMVG